MNQYRDEKMKRDNEAMRSDVIRMKSNAAVLRFQGDEAGAVKLEREARAKEFRLKAIESIHERERPSK